MLHLYPVLCLEAPASRWLTALLASQRWVALPLLP